MEQRQFDETIGAEPGNRHIAVITYSSNRNTWDYFDINDDGELTVNDEAFFNSVDKLALYDLLIVQTASEPNQTWGRINQKWAILEMVESEVLQSSEHLNEVCVKMRIRVRCGDGETSTPYVPDGYRASGTYPLNDYQQRNNYAANTNSRTSRRTHEAIRDETVAAARYFMDHVEQQDLIAGEDELVLLMHIENLQEQNLSGRETYPSRFCVAPVMGLLCGNSTNRHHRHASGNMGKIISSNAGGTKYQSAQTKKVGITRLMLTRAPWTSMAELGFDDIQETLLDNDLKSHRKKTYFLDKYKKDEIKQTIPILNQYSLWKIEAEIDTATGGDTLDTYLSVESDGGYSITAVSDLEVSANGTEFITIPAGKYLVVADIGDESNKTTLLSYRRDMAGLFQRISVVGLSHRFASMFTISETNGSDEANVSVNHRLQDAVKYAGSVPEVQEDMKKKEAKDGVDVNLGFNWKKRLG
ncbi:MAG: hypothetical protein CMB45_05010 [Euryarchaeota archaeon]|nr:hypothetical protein [Euryarchaeota archaeon]|tara:strand:- start:22525 stop:23937 length:1413 start_codon:yes stop_codon:yes gene_type:complete